LTNLRKKKEKVIPQFQRNPKIATPLFFVLLIIFYINKRIKIEVEGPEEKVEKQSKSFSSKDFEFHRHWENLIISG
tara:strand:+ start:339 stop:566 length:228 start_codon:yes stop_codon:yes gene_type:complete